MLPVLLVPGIKGVVPGTLGDVGCFSFHPRKSVTTGEGGMITAARDDLGRLAPGATRDLGPRVPISPAMRGKRPSC